MKERLQKILARSGFGSRRSCEKIIADRRVLVNGVLAHIGDSADVKTDQIMIDGEVIGVSEPQKVYIALNKPRGVLSDVDSKDPRPNVKDMVPEKGHLFAVGRLDLDSEGLILLTNDGELANRLTHPRYGHEKEYEVLVAKYPDEEQLVIWRRGVVLSDGYRTRSAQVSVLRKAGKEAWLKIIMKEGRKRQIREIGNTLGLPVSRLIRVRLATLELGNLNVGEYRYLRSQEIKELKASAGLMDKKPAKKEVNEE